MKLKGKEGIRHRQTEMINIKILTEMTWASGSCSFCIQNKILAISIRGETNQRLKRESIVKN